MQCFENSLCTTVCPSVGVLEYTQRSCSHSVTLLWIHSAGIQARIWLSNGNFTYQASRGAAGLWERAPAFHGSPQSVCGGDSLKPECVLWGCQGNEIIEVITFANSHVDIQHVSLPVIGQPEACML